VRKILFAAAYLCAAQASANDLIAEVGVGAVFSDEYDTLAQLQFRLGYRNVYFTWETLDDASVAILGQELFETQQNYYGVGFRYPFNDDFEVFVEGGIADLDNSVKEFEGQEIAYTYLVGRHAVGDRNIPVPCAYSFQGCYDWGWEMDDTTPFATVGAAYALCDWAKVQVSYRYVNPRFDVEIKDTDWKEGDTYWREAGNIDLSSANFTILLYW